MKNPWSILVVDDEPVQSESMAVWLRQDGYEVDRASSGKEAIQAVREKDYAILFIDLKMPPGIDGIETMTEVHKISPDSSVIIITAYATVDTAISAMKEGAVEYIVKPCNPQEISMLVQRIIRLKNLERENTLLRERLEKSHHFCDIISKNSTMLRICDLVRDIADLPSTVLIQGESGTGKEVVARAIHESGARAGKPFVAVSCAALAESLLESELFGHERGAFTGASQRRQGKFELAQDGTLFLDEIGDISPKLQVDLLRVLQQHSFYRVGGSQEIAVHARTIAATNVNLESAIAEGKFREDLYYRLNVINIRIPPLRERREDIPLLGLPLPAANRAGAGQGCARSLAGGNASASRARVAGQRARTGKRHREGDRLLPGTGSHRLGFRVFAGERERFRRVVDSQRREPARDRAEGDRDHPAPHSGKHQGDGGPVGDRSLDAVR